MVSAKPSKEFALAQKSVEVITITFELGGITPATGSNNNPQEEVIVLFSVSVLKAVDTLTPSLESIARPSDCNISHIQSRSTCGEGEHFVRAFLGAICGSRPYDTGIYKNASYF